MNPRPRILDLRRHFSKLRASTLLVIVAILLSLSSVAATFYTLGTLNTTRNETRIIREDLSAEQAKRLADAEQRVRELALRDKRIMAQTVANRQLILTLRGLIERRPDLFVGVDLPPSITGAKPLANGGSTSKPTTNKPKPNKPKPNKPKPNKPKTDTHGPDPRPNPSVVPPAVPPTNPSPPSIIGQVACVTPITCALLGPE
jgi:cell division septation protein DedD